MQQLQKYKWIAVLLCTLTLLVGCGQKGDLYLPDSKSFNKLMQVN